jgi:hypothetical protein
MSFLQNSSGEKDELVFPLQFTFPIAIVFIVIVLGGDQYPLDFH